MIELPGEDATQALGIAIAARLRAGDVIALFGDLGAGKTTLARGILHGLGFEGEVASPSYPIVQPYEGAELSLPVWHVDLYRIERAVEIEELALDEALGHAVLLIEWPGRLGDRLYDEPWRNALRLHLSVAPDGVRSLTASVPPAWEGRWPPQ